MSDKPEVKSTMDPNRPLTDEDWPKVGQYFTEIMDGPATKRVMEARKNMLPRELHVTGVNQVADRIEGVIKGTDAMYATDIRTFRMVWKRI